MIDIVDENTGEHTGEHSGETANAGQMPDKAPGARAVRVPVAADESLESGPAQEILEQSDADGDTGGDTGGDTDRDADGDADGDAEHDESLSRLRTSVESLIRPVIEGEGFKLYDFEPPYRSGGVLRVYIWKGQVAGRVQGVILDECARVSKALEFLTTLDEAIEGTYILEVSSPGINRKLSRAEHFESAVGEYAKIVTLGGDVLCGPIKDVTAGVITVEDHGVPETEAGKKGARKSARRAPAAELRRVAVGEVKRARIDFQF